MESLELKKLRLELARVSTAKLDLEVRLAEQEIESEKVRKHIQVQAIKEVELQAKLKDLLSKSQD